ncbi:MAG: PaaI family thioesterase [Desulfomonilaceae bacterium]
MKEHKLNIDRKAEPVRFAKEIVGDDPFSRLLGIVCEEAGDSYAKVSLKLKPEYCNSEARSHGGVIFSLADQAFAIACNSRGYMAFAAEMKINYFEATKPGDIVSAEAKPIDIRKRISLWNIEVRNQESTLIAVAHGLAYHFVK